MLRHPMPKTIRRAAFLVVAAAGCIAERGALTNRMAQAGTGYLARAARQPVSWQPWGPEAFALATRLDRPILLYVGAEECRWCARMDREVYADRELGALIDSLFVPVRVDRDERPDVARRYAAAVEFLAGLRGLPLTVILTPDGAAFFGGTYFPGDDPITGRGLRQILPEVARSYRDRREYIQRHAERIRRLAAPRPAPARVQPEALDERIAAVRSALDGAVRARTALGSVAHAQAAALLVAEYRRARDTAALRVAAAALALFVDSLGAPTALDVADDPPVLVRAAVLRDLAAGWAATGEARYRDAGLLIARDLARATERAAERGGYGGYADRDAFVIGSLLEAAQSFGDTTGARAARRGLDLLLRRAYAPGRGVRHVAEGPLRALLQDQVQTASTCLAAYEVFGARRYVEIARDLAAVLERDFADSLGGYFEAARPDPAAPALAERTKPVLDDLLPGANAWAARFLLRLADATGEGDYRRRAAQALEAVAGAVAGEKIRAASYLLAAREAFPRR